jgi:hypothetical protein
MPGRPRGGSISVGEVPEATKASIRDLARYGKEKLGLDGAHVEAMLASALTESGVNPAGKRGASGEEGMFQWLGSRWTNLQKSLGDRQRNPYAQFEYALKEMDTIDPGWRTRTGDARTLSGQWVRRFEKPKYPSDRYDSVLKVQKALQDTMKIVKPTADAARRVLDYGSDWANETLGGKGFEGKAWTPNISPLGVEGNRGEQRTDVSADHTTNVTVYGATDPNATANAVGKITNRQAANHIRALKTALA